MKNMKVIKNWGWLPKVVIRQIVPFFILDKNVFFSKLDFTLEETLSFKTYSYVGTVVRYNFLIQ